MSGPSGSAGAGEGLLEEKVDLSVETEEKLKEARALYEGSSRISGSVSGISGSPGNLDAALAVLFAMEKKCRTNNDAPSLVRVCETSVQLCREAGQVDALVSTLQALATRRSQKSAAVKAMVTMCLPWCVDVDKLRPLPLDGGGPGKVGQVQDFRDKLVVALRDLSDGKLYLERERAILTRVLATIKVRLAGRQPRSPPCRLSWCFPLSFFRRFPHMPRHHHSSPLSLPL